MKRLLGWLSPLTGLLVLYAALLIDLFTGLHLNLFGYGREPLAFALGASVLSGLLYRYGGSQGRWLGMIALALCCAWLVLYPSKNGFDVALSPTLVAGVVLWLWQKRTNKK